MKPLFRLVLVALYARNLLPFRALAFLFRRFRLAE